MNWVDGVLLAVLVLSVLLGIWRGLVYEVLSVAGWVVAFLMAQAYASTVGEWLPMAQFSPALRLAVGFALVFVAISFASGMVSWLVKKWWPQWDFGQWTGSWARPLGWPVAC